MRPSSSGGRSMKILLDENLPSELRHSLVGHEVQSVEYLKWKGIRNGRLMALAIGNGFEVMVTVDKSIPHQ